MNLTILLGICFLWCIFCVLTGTSRIYLYIWLSTQEYIGLYGIIFCEIIGEGMEIARIFFPSFIKEDEEILEEQINYYSDKDEFINIYGQVLFFIFIGVLVLTIIGLKPANIPWELQILSLGFVLFFWGNILYKEGKIIAYLFAMLMNIVLVLLSIKIFPNSESILIYSVIFYQIIFSSVYKSKHKYKAGFNPYLKKASYKERYGVLDNSSNAFLGMLSGFLIGINTSVMCYFFQNEKNSIDAYWGLNRLILLKTGSMGVSLILAIFSLGERDASANYMAIITNKFGTNNDIDLIYILIFCIICIIFSHFCFQFSYFLLEKVQISPAILSKLRLFIIGIIITISNINPFDSIYLIFLCLSFITLRFIKGNNLKPLVASSGLSFIPFLAYFKVI